MPLNAFVLFLLLSLPKLLHCHSSAGTLGWVQPSATPFNLTDCWVCGKDSVGTAVPAPIEVWLRANYSVTPFVSYVNSFPNQNIEQLFFKAWKKDMETKVASVPWSDNTPDLAWLARLRLSTSTRFPICCENTYTPNSGVFVGNLSTSQCNFTFRVPSRAAEEPWNSSLFNSLSAYKDPDQPHLFLRAQDPLKEKTSFWTPANNSCSAGWSPVSCNSSTLGLARGLLLSSQEFFLKIYPSSSLAVTAGERLWFDASLIWRKLSGAASTSPPKLLFKYGFHLSLRAEDGLFFYCGTRAHAFLPAQWTGRCSLAYLAPLRHHAPGAGHMPQVGNQSEPWI
ncbi:unnamed protein product [Gulo gulo]|uniref:Uncharacterized protein n=1 Tax=Gulo gulo TaxID=48420 RepID=A0A9X9LJ10_GULGU|nr:unnamed protein product [Gulo gulo]